MFIMFAFFLVILTFWIGASPIIVPEKAVTYTDRNATAIFLSDWGMKDLLQNTVYQDGDEINIDYWFSEEVDVYQIDKARSVAIWVFVLRHPRNYGPFPYQNIASNRAIEWKTVSCRVYRGEELLHHERYDEKWQRIREP